MTTPWLIPGLFFAVFQEFVKCSNKDIEQIINKEMSGDVKNSMFAIGKCSCKTLDWLVLQPSQYFATFTSFLLLVRSVKNQPSYFADRLYKAMKVRPGSL